MTETGQRKLHAFAGVSSARARGSPLPRIREGLPPGPEIASTRPGNPTRTFFPSHPLADCLLVAAECCRRLPLLDEADTSHRARRGEGTVMKVAASTGRPLAVECA